MTVDFASEYILLGKMLGAKVKDDVTATIALNYRYLIVRVFGWRRQSVDRNVVSVSMRMNSNSMLCSLLIIVLATCIHEGHGIKCWDCSSNVDPACADPFDNATLPITDCDLLPELPHLPGVRATICRKIKQKVNGETTIFRGCGRLDDPAVPTGGKNISCQTRTNKHKIFVKDCTCSDKDGCNAGPTVNSNQFFILFAALLTFFMNRFQNIQNNV